jgi:hypothetical protein
VPSHLRAVGHPALDGRVEDRRFSFAKVARLDLLLLLHDESRRHLPVDRPNLRASEKRRAGGTV